MIYMGKSPSYDVNWETEIISQIIIMIYRCLTVIRIIAVVQEPNGLKLYYLFRPEIISTNRT